MVLSLGEQTWGRCQSRDTGGVNKVELNFSHDLGYLGIDLRSNSVRLSGWGLVLVCWQLFEVKQTLRLWFDGLGDAKKNAECGHEQKNISKPPQLFGNVSTFTFTGFCPPTDGYQGHPPKSTKSNNLLERTVELCQVAVLLWILDAKWCLIKLRRPPQHFLIRFTSMSVTSVTSGAVWSPMASDWEGNEWKLKRFETDVLAGVEYRVPGCLVILWFIVDWLTIQEWSVLWNHYHRLVLCCARQDIKSQGCRWYACGTTVVWTPNKKWQISKWKTSAGARVLTRGTCGSLVCNRCSICSHGRHSRKCLFAP